MPRRQHTHAKSTWFLQWHLHNECAIPLVTQVLDSLWSRANGLAVLAAQSAHLVNSCHLPLSLCFALVPISRKIALDKPPLLCFTKWFFS